LRAGSVREVRSAIEAAHADGSRLSAGAVRYFNEHLDFRNTFRPVADLVDSMAVGRAGRRWVSAEVEPAAMT
jgi:hypothetical protein